MKKLIIVMAILLTSCVENRVESTDWVEVEISVESQMLLSIK